MQLSYEYEGETIAFSVMFRKRKTMSIQVRPPDTVIVLSPVGKSKKDILQTVQTKSKWILKKRAEVKEMSERKPERKYIDGEEFFYLGQPYRLRIIVDGKYKRPKIAAEGKEILVCLARYDAQEIRFVLEQWYKAKALETIVQRIDHYQGFFDVKPTQIIVKSPKRSWGSCSSTRKLSFNFKCVMLPLPVLDYIVVHEMSHMIELNHSKEFWGLVESILPDYKQRNQWVKNNGVVCSL